MVEMTEEEGKRRRMRRSEIHELMNENYEMSHIHTFYFQKLSPYDEELFQIVWTDLRLSMSGSVGDLDLYL